MMKNRQWPVPTYELDGASPGLKMSYFFRFHWLGVIRRMFPLYIGEIHIQTRQAIGILIVKKCWNGSGHKHFQRFCIFHWRNFNGVMFVFYRGKKHIPDTPSHWDFIFQCRCQPSGCFLHYIIYREGTSLCCRRRAFLPLKSPVYIARLPVARLLKKCYNSIVEREWKTLK